MTVAAAARPARRSICFVGIGLPSTAANLARPCTHPPGAYLRVRHLGAKAPTCCHCLIGDGGAGRHAGHGDQRAGGVQLLAPARAVSMWVSLARRNWTGYANINTTVVGGGYAHPGSGCRCRRCAGDRRVLPRSGRHRPADGRPSWVGWTSSPASASVPGRVTGPGWACAGAGPTMIITDLGVLEPDPVSCELTLTHLHPGVTVEQAANASAGRWRWRHGSGTPGRPACRS